MATYSITRALVELKRLDSRISSAIALEALGRSFESNHPDHFTEFSALGV